MFHVSTIVPLRRTDLQCTSSVIRIASGGRTVGSCRQIDLISERTGQENASTFFKKAHLGMLRRDTLTSEMKCQAFLAENVNMAAFWVVTTQCCYRRFWDAYCLTWRWTPNITPKCRLPYTRLHGVLTRTWGGVCIERHYTCYSRGYRGWQNLVTGKVRRQWRLHIWVKVHW